MGELTDCDGVDTGRRNLSRSLEGQATARLQPHLRADLVTERHRGAHLLGGEVVDQHLLGTRFDRMAEPVEAVDFDLDRDRSLQGAHGCIGRGDPTRAGDMVVLDHRSVEEAHAMVDPATAANGVLLQCPQARKRLSGVADHGAGSGKCRDPPCSLGGNPREMAEQVERTSLGGEQQAGRGGDPSDCRTGRNNISIGHQMVDVARCITTHHLDNGSNDRQTGNHPGFTSRERHDTPLITRDRRNRCDIDTVGKILGERSSDHLLDRRRIEADSLQSSRRVDGQRMRNEHGATLARCGGGGMGTVESRLPSSRYVAYRAAMANPRADPVTELRERLGRSVRTMLAGDPEPRAMPLLEEDRRFPSTSAVWAVHSDISMLVGGLRALLLQTLHPPTLAGVTQHSTYRTDPLGRLQRTGAFLGVTTFGSRADADQAVAMVRAVHEHVVGTTADGAPYAATDPHLLAWVHCTEVDSFLRARMRYGVSPLPADMADRYVQEMGEIGAELGVVEPPQNRHDLRTRLQSYRSELAASPDTHETVRFLAFPPLSLAARAPYGVVFAAATSMLPRFAQRQLRLPVVPLAEPLAIRPAATLLLRTIGWALGEHPARRAAQQA